MDRCDFSDLPADQCGCPHCRPDLAPPPPAVRPVVVRTLIARHPGKCSRCDRFFPADERIGATEDRDYICERCIA